MAHANILFAGTSGRRSARMERPDWAPETIDMERPSAARIYDYWLGGSHNFAVDREVARQVTSQVPETPLIMQANRAFLHRAARFLVESGIQQFLDIGSGIPTLGNVHEVVQKATPDARVVYVDIDPVAVAHSRHILAGNERVTVIQEDLRRPDLILSHAETSRLLDLDQPVALLLLAVLHFIPDDDDPYGTVARLSDALAPGSYVAISHGTMDHYPVEVTRLAAEQFRRTPTPIWSRSRAETARFFAGLDLVEPGIVYSSQWRPEHPDEVDDHP